MCSVSAYFFASKYEKKIMFEYCTRHIYNYFKCLKRSINSKHQEIIDKARDQR